MPSLPSLPSAKAQAKKLRLTLAAAGTQIGHASALEQVAQHYGFRDWNAMSAAIAQRNHTPWTVGEPVKGRYLSKTFHGVVRSIEPRAPDWYHLEIELDDAIDVVSFDGFSNHRTRVRGTVGPKGFSRECTSDGTPHLEIALV